MAKRKDHIPFLETITDFFEVYGIGKPLYPDVMCMRLEDQPDSKLEHMPLSRANFFRVIFFTNRNLQFYSAEKKSKIVNNSVCFTYPGKLESWTRSGKLQGYVVYFSAGFAELDVTHKHFDKSYPYFNFNSEHMISLSEDEADELRVVAEEMIREINGMAEDNLEMLKKLLHIYLHKIRRIYVKRVTRIPVEVMKSKALYDRFRKELDTKIQNVAKEKHGLVTVSALAKVLGVNANYLNGSIKALTGKTASEHIKEKVILEAKSYLIHTSVPVSEVACSLGFDNPTYFNKFFKKNTGVAPLKFRNQFAIDAMAT